MGNLCEKTTLYEPKKCYGCSFGCVLYGFTKKHFLHREREG